MSTKPTSIPPIRRRLDFYEFLIRRESRLRSPLTSARPFGGEGTKKGLLACACLARTGSLLIGDGMTEDGSLDDPRTSVANR